MRPTRREHTPLWIDGRPTGVRHWSTWPDNLSWGLIRADGGWVISGELDARTAPSLARVLSADPDGDGAWQWDARSGATTWDPMMEQIFGLRDGGFAGTFDHWVQLLHPDDRDDVLRTLQVALDTHRDYEIEYRILQSDLRPPHALTEEQLTQLISRSTGSRRSADAIAATIGEDIEALMPIVEGQDDVALLVVRID